MGNLRFILREIENFAVNFVLSKKNLGKGNFDPCGKLLQKIREIVWERKNTKRRARVDFLNREKDIWRAIDRKKDRKNIEIALKRRRIFLLDVPNDI